MLNSLTKPNIYENISLSLERMDINSYPFIKILTGDWNKENSKGGVMKYLINRFN